MGSARIRVLERRTGRSTLKLITLQIEDILTMYAPQHGHNLWCGFSEQLASDDAQCDHNHQLTPLLQERNCPSDRGRIIGFSDVWYLCQSSCEARRAIDRTICMQV